MCRRVLVFCLAASLPLFSSPAAPGEPSPVSARPIVLNPGDPAQTVVGKLQYLGGLEISSSEARFGGLSALWVSPDGGRLVALSDHGHWFRARLVYDEDGRLAGIVEGEIGALVDPHGRPLDRQHGDAESLARMPDGAFIVAFERVHRLWRYPASAEPFQAQPAPLPRPPGLAKAPGNGGIEALTPLLDGRLLAITEDLEADAGVLVAWLGAGAEWQALAYLRAGAFSPTGAATLPGGDVLVVERRFDPARGSAARVRRVSQADIAPGARLEGIEIARFEAPLQVDNFEGIAVRRSAAGETLVYLLSDDNYNPAQRTLLLMFALRE